MEDLIIDEIHQMCDYLDKQTDHPLKINLVFNLSVVNALWTLITGYILYLSSCLIILKSTSDMKGTSVVSNFELLDARSFLLGKVCVHARSKFEIVIFCAPMLA